MVEFALILPILLVMLIGIADLGRVFTAGIVVEGAARDGAEIGARSYLKENPAGPPTPGSYYQNLHLRVAKAVCAEIKNLPGTTFDSVTGECPSMPVTVCVHDGVDDACGIQTFAASPAPECTVFFPPATNAIPASGETSSFVEVRVCYKFTSITQSPFFSFGTIFLQQARTFTVANY
jgi:hypothetical protein